MEWIPLGIALVSSLFGGGNTSSTRVIYKPDPNQEALLKQMRENLETQVKESKAIKESYEKNQKKLEELQKEVDNIADPKEFAKNQSKFTNQFIDIIKSYKFPERKEYEIKGKKPVVVIGPTSSGKSYLLNAIAGTKVAEVGIDETTMTISNVYQSDSLAFFDAPGENDRVKTFDFTVLAFLKTMKCVIVVYRDDPNCVSNLIRICDALKINIICVRNQIDNADETPEELVKVKEGDLHKITKEIIPSSPNFKGLFFLSARNKFQKKSELYEWLPFVSTLLEVTSKIQH